MQRYPKRERKPFNKDAGYLRACAEEKVKRERMDSEDEEEDDDDEDEEEEEPETPKFAQLFPLLFQYF